MNGVRSLDYVLMKPGWGTRASKWVDRWMGIQQQQCPFAIDAVLMEKTGTRSTTTDSDVLMMMVYGR